MMKQKNHVLARRRWSNPTDALVNVPKELLDILSLPKELSHIDVIASTIVASVLSANSN